MSPTFDEKIITTCLFLSNPNLVAIAFFDSGIEVHDVKTKLT